LFVEPDSAAPVSHEAQPLVFRSSDPSGPRDAAPNATSAPAAPETTAASEISFVSRRVDPVASSRSTTIPSAPDSAEPATAARVPSPDATSPINAPGPVEQFGSTARPTVSETGPS